MSAGPSGPAPRPPAGRPTLSAVVVTWNRPDFVSEALAALGAQDEPVEQVVVVDASADGATREVCRKYNGVLYLRFARGAGHMTAARNAGLLHTRGEVVAYLDDDARPTSGWAGAVRGAYHDPQVCAVVGRTVNSPDDARPDDPAVPIGRVLPNGMLTACFERPGSDLVDVHHGIGANMSFRRTTLIALGGFYEDWPGTALREDTDMFLRVGRCGLRTVFCPQALAIHVAAPHVKGRRFDHRYEFFAHRNHAVLLSRHHGLFSRVFLRWLRAVAQSQPNVRARNALFRRVRILAAWSGVVVGTAAAGRRGWFFPASVEASGPVAHLVRMTVGAARTGADADVR